MRGAELIAVERQRQIDSEGFKPEHDDQHTRCELLDAALCYLEMAGSQIEENGKEEARFELLDVWPWEQEWWKPSNDPIRNLVKAGALIAAEIERLQRNKEESGENG